MSDYDTERRVYVDKQFYRTREQEELDSRRLQQRQEEMQKRRAHRSEREQSLVLTALTGQVTDVPAVLHTLMECVTQGKGSTPNKKRSRVALDLLGEGAATETTSGSVRRFATLSRQRAMNSVFEGSKAKKIELIGQELGLNKWVARVPTEALQLEFNALRVEMLLLSKLQHMLTAKEERRGDDDEHIDD